MRFAPSLYHSQQVAALTTLACVDICSSDEGHMLSDKRHHAEVGGR